MADQMKVSEAIGIARGLQNHYKAFERIVDLLEVVQGLERSIPNLENRQKEASRRTALEEKRLADRKTEVDTAIAQMDTKINLERKRHGNEISKMNRERADLLKEMRAEKSSLQGEISKLEQSHSEYMVRIDKEKVALEKTINKLKSELDGLKNRVASV